MYSKNTIEQDSKANCIALNSCPKHITMQRTNYVNSRYSEKFRVLREQLNLTKDEKSTVSGDKPFHTPMTHSGENENLTAREQ